MISPAREDVGFLDCSDGKQSTYRCRRCGFDLWVGRSPGEGNDYPHRYSCLENSVAEEPGGLQSMGLQRVGRDWATKQALRRSGAIRTLTCYWWECRMVQPFKKTVWQVLTKHILTIQSSKSWFLVFSQRIWKLISIPTHRKPRTWCL